MSGFLTTVVHRALATLARQKTTVVLAVVIALTSAGTAAAVSYVVLGGINTSTATTTLRSDVNGTVLQVSNFNAAGGVSARGINITVPAGRPPITVGTTAGKATNLNADLLDGKNASDFLGVNQTAANAEMLDGRDSTSFMTGPGRVVRGAVAVGPGGSLVTEVAQDPDFWSVSYYCPNPVASNGSIYLINNAGEHVNVFLDNGGSNPEYVQMSPGEVINRGANASGEWYDIQIHSPWHGIAEISLFTVHRPATPDCHAQLQAVMAYR